MFSVDIHRISNYSVGEKTRLTDMESIVKYMYEKKGRDKKNVLSLLFFVSKYMSCKKIRTKTPFPTANYIGRSIDQTYMPISKISEGRREPMGNRKRESAPVIQFHTDDPVITLTFSAEESAGVKAVILDILTEAYRERLQKDFLFAKVG